MDEVECIVIGAGVVGLACGAALARSGRETFVLEGEGNIGLHTSSRNSEVIHAGIYYPAGSLKARMCVDGKSLLYRYAEERKIAHSRIGKLIVATNEEEREQLLQIRRKAAANGVDDLRVLNADGAHDLEPAVTCVGALFSPSTGIIDSHALMLSLQGDLEDHNGAVVLNTPVTACEVSEEGFIVHTGGESPTTIKCRSLVNSAGLYATQIARKIRGLSHDHIPQPRYAAGHYYRAAGASPCNHLVYPVPVAGGLGIHLTLDLGGQARFGPDVRWIDRIDYRFDDSRREKFAEAIQRYLPEIEPDDLVPGYTGIRPKISGAGEPAADFRIDTECKHGIRGLINLFGIESPGLTSSLAIGKYVAAVLA